MQLLTAAVVAPEDGDRTLCTRGLAEPSGVQFSSGVSQGPSSGATTRCVIDRLLAPSGPKRRSTVPPSAVRALREDEVVGRGAAGGWGVNGGLAPPSMPSFLWANSHERPREFPYNKMLNDE